MYREATHTPEEIDDMGMKRNDNPHELASAIEQPGRGATVSPRFVVVDPAASAENTSGHLGVLTLSNVYLSTYADYTVHPHPRTLGIGQRTQATFRLSGEKGTYDIVRVE